MLYSTDSSLSLQQLTNVMKPHYFRGYENGSCSGSPHRQMEVDGRSDGNGKMPVMLCLPVCKSAAGSLSPMCTSRTRALWNKHCYLKLSSSSGAHPAASAHMAALWLVLFCSYSQLFAYISPAYVMQGLFRLSQWLDDETTAGGGFSHLLSHLAQHWSVCAGSRQQTRSVSIWYLTNSLQLFVIHLGQNHQMIAIICHHRRRRMLTHVDKPETEWNTDGVKWWATNEFFLFLLAIATSTFIFVLFYLFFYMLHQMRKKLFILLMWERVQENQVLILEFGISDE